MSSALANTYTRGTPVALGATEEIDVEVFAAFDPATTLTSINFELFVSDDLVNWEPITSIRTGTGNTAAEQVFTASAGNTVKDRLQTNAHRNAKYVAVGAKFVGGSPAAGDSATSNLSYGTIV